MVVLKPATSGKAALNATRVVRHDVSQHKCVRSWRYRPVTLAKLIKAESTAKIAFKSQCRHLGVISEF